MAEKMVGDFSKTADARNLFNEVLTDSTYVPDAHTYYVGAAIERGVYKHYYKLLSINRKDPSVDKVAMADALMNIYRYSLKSMSMDTTFDKKGTLKVKYSPELSSWITESAPSLYNSGVAYLNKNLYNKAHDAFIEYASLPDKSYYITLTPMSDSIRATAYFYGGVMAYKNKMYEPALLDFANARKYGYTRKEVFLNQISCLSNLAKENPELTDSLSLQITRVAQDGMSLYSVTETPVFIQKYVAGKLIENAPNEALAALDTALLLHPNMTMLIAMKAGVYSLMEGREEEAALAYMQAANDSIADAITLKAASKFLARHGIDLLDGVTGRGKQASLRKKEIRNTYLRSALDFARRAMVTLKDDPELLNTIETVNYRMH